MPGSALKKQPNIILLAERAGRDPFSTPPIFRDMASFALIAIHSIFWGMVSFERIALGIVLWHDLCSPFGGRADSEMASKRRARRIAAKSCCVKIRHETIIQAQEHAYAISVREVLMYGRDPRRPPIVPYACEVCGGWHVGHKPGGRQYRHDKQW